MDLLLDRSRLLAGVTAILARVRVRLMLRRRLCVGLPSLLFGETSLFSKGSVSRNVGVLTDLVEARDVVDGATKVGR